MSYLFLGKWRSANVLRIPMRGYEKAMPELHHKNIRGYESP